MLVSPLRRQHQVTPRRKYSKCESRIESAVTRNLAMFTRAQATAANTPAKSTDTTTISTNVSSQSVTTSANSATSLTVTSGTSVPVPTTTSNVSLTITAVATSTGPDGIPIITTTSVPFIDTPTLTNIVLNSLEGVHSGVPTRTTPTLTPTTLRNIEQTFLELSTLPPPENHTNQAGFVPPLVQPNGGSTYVSVDSKCWGGGTLTQIPHTTSVTSTSSAPSGGALQVRQPPTTHTSTTASTLAMPSQIQPQQLPSRRMGGRRPVKDEKGMDSEDDSRTFTHSPLSFGDSPAGPLMSSFHNQPPDRYICPAGDSPTLTVEEEEKRCLRRERNKLAAARCRKRRLDQTNMLQDETDDLEDKKSGLQQEIQLLQQQRDELEFLLATHKAVCRRRFQNSTSLTATSIPAAAAAAAHSVAMTTTAAPTTITTSSSLGHHQANPAKKVLTLKLDEVTVKEEPLETDEEMVPVVKHDAAPRPRRPTSLAVAPVALRTPSVADLGVPIETPSAGLRGLNFESMMEGGTGLTPVTSGSTALTPFHSGLTPLTTPVVTAPTSVSSSSGNCGSQQRSSSSDLSSPDSVPPKLVSL